MNLLRIGGGGFFGILIPGAFLLFNAVLTLPALSLHLTNITSEPGKSDFFMLSLIYLMFSCMLGIILRILPPDLTEKGHKDKFPYFDYFFLKKAYKKPKRFLDFYEHFFTAEYPDLIGANRWQDVICTKQSDMGRSLINYFKLYIYQKSQRLKDEIQYSEGLTRFVCGMCYSLLTFLTSKK